MLQIETALTLARIHGTPREAERLLVQIQDPRLEVERPRVPIRDRLQEVIQHQDQQQERGLQIVQDALIQPRDQIDLRHARAHLLQQGQDQPHEVVAAEALHEEEIIRHK